MPCCVGYFFCFREGDGRGLSLQCAIPSLSDRVQVRNDC